VSSRCWIDGLRRPKRWSVGRRTALVRRRWFASIGRSESDNPYSVHEKNSLFYGLDDASLKRKSLAELIPLRVPALRAASTGGIAGRWGVRRAESADPRGFAAVVADVGRIF
jgi:hypothetical protein